MCAARDKHPICTFNDINTDTPALELYLTVNGDEYGLNVPVHVLDLCAIEDFELTFNDLLEAPVTVNLSFKQGQHPNIERIASEIGILEKLLSDLQEKTLQLHTSGDQTHSRVSMKVYLDTFAQLQRLNHEINEIQSSERDLQSDIQERRLQYRASNNYKLRKHM